MKNSIGLYFNLEIKENPLAFFLVNQSLKQIEHLQDLGIQVEYLQLRAKKLSGPFSDKQIWLKIDSNKGTYMASDTSPEWNQAFIHVLKMVEDKMLYEEVNYTRHADLIEINLATVPVMIST